jgi:hypothetical protein
MACRCQYITIRGEFVREEGDGSPCHVCGELCWLEMRRLVLRIGGEPETYPQAEVLCIGCAAALEDG